MESNNWQKIYTANQSYQAEIIHSFLEDHGIESVILNKKDSSYNNFGNYEIFVAKSNTETAQTLINEYVSF